MMARRGVLATLAGAAAALLGGCDWSLAPSFRFRMTVEVQTPQGPVSGSSVLEIQANRQTDLMTGGNTVGVDLTGEAVAVDLPDGRTLFAVLRLADQKIDDLPTVVMKTLDPQFDYDRADSAMRIARGRGAEGPVALSPEAYPLLVMFADIADPTSVERVDPAAIGVTRITLETTDDPVTTGIERRLAWLEAVGRERGALKPSHSRYLKDAKLINRVRATDFNTELFK